MGPRISGSGFGARGVRGQILRMRGVKRRIWAKHAPPCPKLPYRLSGGLSEIPGKGFETPVNTWQTPMCSRPPFGVHLARIESSEMGMVIRMALGLRFRGQVNLNLELTTQTSCCSA